MYQYDSQRMTKSQSIWLEAFQCLDFTKQSVIDLVLKMFLKQGFPLVSKHKRS